eukprot:CAMPEP_0172500890 /NCGR_PEP_ID=MMETSP1066-20121228/143967_1 /TAXON_ID=671091 /ORGANISM="Coscinodiscus wailesii, Strain CCMP2513" /LENGTH=172 /DNA_ID=CAMNT_0013275371 /DNA_START=153 /DNA_END=671 /DNA_ORIENTATION=-
MNTKLTTTTTTTNRRDVLSKFATGALFGVTAAVLPATAIDDCPKGSKNCVRATWTPPSGTSKSDAVAALRDAINAYPQAGQDNVDGGGWVVTGDDLDGSGVASVEYKSSGKGNFAKFFNGGKPFTDDLKLEVSANGVVEVRSSSRVGESDFGVNAKRVGYLANSLAAKGWGV